MGSSIAQIETVVTAENQSWLGSAHGTNECESCQLDASAFLATFPDGVVPSGVVLGKITATGLYKPYADGAADGSEVAAGHLFTTTDLKGTTAPTAQDVSAALFWHGQVIEAKLPVGHGLNAAAKTDLKHIHYV